MTHCFFFLNYTNLGGGSAAILTLETSLLTFTSITFSDAACNIRVLFCFAFHNIQHFYIVRKYIWDQFTTVHNQLHQCIRVIDMPCLFTRSQRRLDTLLKFNNVCNAKCRAACEHNYELCPHPLCSIMDNMHRIPHPF